MVRDASEAIVASEATQEKMEGGETTHRGEERSDEERERGRLCHLVACLSPLSSTPRPLHDGAEHLIHEPHTVCALSMEGLDVMAEVSTLQFLFNTMSSI